MPQNQRNLDDNPGCLEYTIILIITGLLGLTAWFSASVARLFFRLVANLGKLFLVLIGSVIVGLIVASTTSISFWAGAGICFLIMSVLFLIKPRQ